MNSDLLIERIHDLTHPISLQTVNHKTQLHTLDDISCVALDFYGTMFISGVGDIGIDEAQEKNSDYFSESLTSTGFKILNKSAGKKGIHLFDEAIEANMTATQNKGINYPEPDVRSVWFDVLRQLIDENYIDGNLTKQSANHFGVEFEFRINKIWPVPKLDEFLHSLLDHGLTLGIISNSQFYTPIAFEAFLGSSPEEFGFNPNLLIWSFESGRKKPSQHLYQQFVDAAEKENIQPQEILYVGNDIQKDIHPANTLGMKTALFVGDERSIRHTTDDLESDGNQPDLIIENLHQILDCLQF